MPEFPVQGSREEEAALPVVDVGDDRAVEPAAEEQAGAERGELWLDADNGATLDLWRQLPDLPPPAGEVRGVLGWIPRHRSTSWTLDVVPTDAPVMAPWSVWRLRRSKSVQL